MITALTALAGMATAGYLIYKSVKNGDFQRSNPELSKALNLDNKDKGNSIKPDTIEPEDNIPVYDKNSDDIVEKIMNTNNNSAETYSLNPEGVAARNWQEYMYNKYQSPSAMVEQYKAAGLNPLLATNFSGSMPTASSGAQSMDMAKLQALTSLKVAQIQSNSALKVAQINSEASHYASDMNFAGRWIPSWL